MRRVGLGPAPPVENQKELLKWLKNAVEQLGRASHILEIPETAPAADSYLLWDTTVSPKRPVWTASSEVVSTAAVIADNAVVRGDGGANGVQDSGVLIDDSDNVTGIVDLTMTGYLDIAEISAPTDPASNVMRLYAYDDGAGKSRAAVKDSAGVLTVLGSRTPAECRLDYVSTTSIQLNRRNGKYLFIAGTAYEIPSTGPTLANTGLTASTLYYIYAYMSSGTMTLEASATAYATDSTYGHPIKSGDGTRSLVGMVYMDTGTPGTFADSATQRWVISYYNRKMVEVYITKGSLTTSTASPWSELDTSLRTSFLHWGDGSIAVSTLCLAYHATANIAMYYRVAFGVAVGTYATGIAAASFGVSAAANYYTTLTAASYYTPAAGFNTATAQGGVDSGTANYAGAYHGYTLLIHK